MGVTERRVRQLAELLHAERDLQGNWWFDEAVVMEHAEARAEQTRGSVSAKRIERLEADMSELMRMVLRLQNRVMHLEAFHAHESAGPLGGEEDSQQPGA